MVHQAGMSTSILPLSILCNALWISQRADPVSGDHTCHGMSPTPLAEHTTTSVGWIIPSSFEAGEGTPKPSPTHVKDGGHPSDWTPGMRWDFRGCWLSINKGRNSPASV